MAPRVTAAALCLGLLTAGCAAAEPGDPRVLTVFAAASLTDPFETLGERFAEETGTAVEFNFAGSSQLARQIGEGAPAGVFASADPETMDRVGSGGDLVEKPELLARNTLEIAVPAGNPAGVAGLADLTNPEVTVALCAEEVPCGSAARRAMDAAGVHIDPATRESNVKAALTRVRLGEVDAALVYRSDILAAGNEVTGVPLAEPARNDYLIATLAEAPEPEVARGFVDLALSPEGAAVLTEAGFEAPT